jgi:hypothetical protein
MIYMYELTAQHKELNINPYQIRLRATPPSTKYQRSNPRSQIAILKKNASLDIGIQVWYLSTRHVANSIYVPHCTLKSKVGQIKNLGIASYHEYTTEKIQFFASKLT